MHLCFLQGKSQIQCNLDPVCPSLADEGPRARGLAPVVAVLVAKAEHELLEARPQRLGPHREEGGRLVHALPAHLALLVIAQLAVRVGGFISPVVAFVLSDFWQIQPQLS